MQYCYLDEPKGTAGDVNRVENDEKQAAHPEDKGWQAKVGFDLVQHS